MNNRRANPNTEAVDDYLKAIFTLSGPNEERVNSTALAATLGVAPASITNMLQKLADAPIPLVEYELRRGVRLSAAGKQRALEIVRHHRLLETFLYEVLEYPIEEVHEEAERLEHFISERFEERIDAKLGRPKFDPHGHCIPALDGKMSKQASKPLTEVGEAEMFVVDSVSDADATLLKRLNAHGITPGASVLVINRSQNEFVLRAGALKTLRLSGALADAVRIRSSDLGR